MTEEKKIYQFAYNWAVHEWYGLDSEYEKNPDDEVLQEEVQEAWQIVEDIENIAKENGYKIV